MAESALISLLFKLASLAHREFQLQRGIIADAEKLKAEVERMMEFLQYAEAHQDNELLSRVWVSQVRDAAYDSEDALDEFALLASVRQHLDKISVAHKYIFTPLKLFGANRGVANNMKTILSKFVSVSHRNDRYRLEPRPTLGNRLATSGRVNQPYNALFLNESDLVGIRDPKLVLTRSLLSEDQFKVIPVLGMGGIGKTTLVKNVYDYAAHKTLFQALAWITFSQAFSKEELLKDLIKQLCNNSAAQLVVPGVETMTGVETLQKKVHKILQDIRYMVVLDDVWSVDAWNFIGCVFPKRNRCRVMLTTQMAEVAYTSCQSRDHIYQMKSLSDEHAWDLLSKTISFSESPDLAQLKVAFTGTMEKIEGLPLAIAAFGSVVRAKLMRGDTVSEISNLYSSSIGQAQNYISNVLLYSYQDLPHHLKCCFLYISIFIEGSRIKKSRLLRLWMAEGFVAHNESITMEKVAEEYLTELHDRNLLQVAETRSDGRVKSYRMHGLFRDVLMLKATDQNFALVVNNGEDPSWRKKVRRLSMHHKLRSTLPEQNLRKLRTLLLLQVNNHLSSSSFPQLYTRGFKLLTVMDLQGANLDIFPPSIAKLLNLRYISLRDTNVKEIPRWIGKLLKLQTIDCKGTSINKLPDEILELECLRNLLIYRYDSDEITHSKSGFKAPEEIQCVPSLQKLCFVDAGKSGANIVKKVGSLIQLCRLGIINLSSKNGTRLCSSIQMLQNLQSLSLTSAEGEILDLHTLLAPPLRLRRLYLTGKLTYFPEWILLLKELVKIYLKSSELSQDPLQKLEQLPNLVHIELSRSYTGKTMHFASDKFKKLRILGVHNMDSLERLTVGKKAMKDLEKFVFGSCRSMKTVPQGIEHLRKPGILQFVNMPSELYEFIDPGQQQGPDYHKVAHIPVINIV